ncbi:phosphoribosylpyrophosphate synthetase [Mucilaginibacter sp.]
MKQQFHYATVTEAIEALRKQGFTLDFNLKENQLIVGDQAYTANEFEIVDVYRYEGPSDPGDEATVYALANKSGLKGVLVSGYGASSDEASEETLKQLHYKYQQSQS